MVYYRHTPTDITRLKVWNNDTWQSGTLKCWDGTTWQAGGVKVLERYKLDNLIPLTII